MKKFIRPINKKGENMKRSNFKFKLLAIIIALVTIGCFQFAASQSQGMDSSDNVPITIFSSAYKHIPGLEKDADKIIITVRNVFKLNDKEMNYHRVLIDVIDENGDAEGDFLIVHFLLKDRYTSEISKITLDKNYEVLWIENDYKPVQGESSNDRLATTSCNCPDTSVDIVLSTCCDYIPTALAGINYSYDAAVSAGYNTVKLLGSQENTSDIKDWLCCPKLIYWGRIGHGCSSGIYLDDGLLSYTYFNGLPAGALEGKSLYFNSCQVFNDPLKSSILNKDAFKFVGGICNLWIGPSEEVFKCWNDKNFYQVPPSPHTSDEMCYWSAECESSTGYPDPGCHGCGGPGLIFPVPFNQRPYNFVGGYYGTDWGNTIPPVQAFLDNIGGPCVYVVGGPFAANVAHWDTYNNYDPSWNWGIDWYEFVYSCEHGGPWQFWVNDGVVDLFNVGDPVIDPYIENDGGWGDYFTNWVCLYSCYVVCSPIEKPYQWWYPWVFDDDDIFSSNDRLHIVNGFHTPAWIYPAVNVSTQYAIRLKYGGRILYEWFDCITAFGGSDPYDKACSVFFSECRYDTLCSHTEGAGNSLTIKYMD
jgi:hypothetical protein